MAQELPSREVARQEVARLRLAEDRIRQERELWETLVHGLDALDKEAKVEQPPAQVPSEVVSSKRVVGHNATVIDSILKEAGKPLRIRDIAARAHSSRLIQNERGYEGVYGIVQTVLKRNGKRRYVREPGGLWDLRDHQGSPMPLPLAAAR